MFWRTTEWFMALPEPTAPQSAFVSVIVGAGAAWFGLYVGSGGRRVQVMSEITDLAKTIREENESRAQQRNCNGEGYAKETVEC